MYKMGNKTDEEILRELNMKNITKYGAVIAYSSVVIFAGILGNILSFVYYRFNSRRTTTNILITWLAATDLVTCIVFIDEIIRICFTVNFKNLIGCWMIDFFNHSLVIISTCLFVIISVDRYRKICRPHHWQLTIAKIKVLLVCVIIFALTTSVKDIVDLEIKTSNITDPDTGRQIVAYYCTLNKNPDLKISTEVSAYFDLFVFVASVISSAVVYTIIVCNLWKYQQIKRQRNTDTLHIVNKQNSTTVFESHSKSIENTCNGEPAGLLGTMHNATEVHKMSGKTLGSKQDKETGYASDCSVEDNTKLSDDVICDSGIVETKSEKGKRNNIKDFIFAEKTKQSHNKIERNITFMMIAISTAAILSYVPYFIVNVTLNVSLNTPDEDFDVGLQIALRSFLVNNSSRPYIIGLFNTEFRRFIKNLFRKFLSCISAVVPDTRRVLTT